MIWILLLGYCATYFRLTPLTFHSFINTTAFRWNLWAQGGILNLYNRDMACIKIYQNITISCSKTILARLDPTNAATWFASPIQLEGSLPDTNHFWPLFWWQSLAQFTSLYFDVKQSTSTLQYLLVRTCKFVSDFGMSLGIGLQLFNCLRCRAQDTHTIPTWLFFAASKEAMTAARTSSSLGTTKRGLLSRSFLQRTFQSRTVKIEYGHALRSLSFKKAFIHVWLEAAIWPLKALIICHSCQ